MKSSHDKYFLQEPPSLKDYNRFEVDYTLKNVLSRLIPQDVLTEIGKDLSVFSERINREIEPLHYAANQSHKYPILQTYDGWGKRIDKIHVCEEWNRMHEIAAEEGVISIGYNRKLGKYSRLHQYLKLYYFVPVSALYSCPLAMTDGAVRLIEQLRKSKSASASFLYPSILDEAYSHMTSNNGKEFWTSGQWMTEKVGGSDIGNSETIAKFHSSTSADDKLYELHGYKYFTSATTANITFTLARVIDENGNFIKGSRGLSLFVLKLRNDKGELNHLIVHKLKDKLGTKTLPTAELELIGTRAYLVGNIGEGVRTIAHLFNITRIWTTFSSVGAMYHSLSLLRDYSKKRTAFGHYLNELPAHLASLSNLEVEYRGQLHLFLKVALLLGEDECEPNEKAEKLLRLLTPICKLFSTKETMKFAQEALELFGSPGYMEDTGLPSILRDAQVNTIWEGTSNIMSLDTLRAISKDPSCLEVFYDDIIQRSQSQSTNNNATIKHHSNIIVEGVQNLRRYQPKNQFEAEFNARNFAYRLASIYAASLLLEQASATNNDEDIYTLVHWCRNHTLVLQTESSSATNTITRLSIPSKL